MLGEADLVVELLVDAGELVMRLCQVWIELQAFLKVLDGFRCLARLYERLAEFVVSLWKVRVEADSFSQLRDCICAVFLALFRGQLSVTIVGQIQIGTDFHGLAKHIQGIGCSVVLLEQISQHDVSCFVLRIERNRFL